MNTTFKRDSIDALYGSPLSVLSDSLRGFLVAPVGYDLIAADFSNIEGRVLAWLAGESWKIQAFEAFDAKKGPDIYKLAASGIYHCKIEEIDDKKRQVGKVAELALGYGGGKGAFQQMAKGYGVKVSEKEADQIKRAWRDSHYKIVTYWADLERAAIDAVLRQGETHFAGEPGRQVKYRKNGSFLFCQLPSKRCLTYPYPELWKQVWVTLKKGSSEKKKTFRGRTAEVAKRAATFYAEKEGFTIAGINEPSEALVYKGVVNNHWDYCDAYGGLLAENNTQAVARDVLAEALKRVEKCNYPVVFHVHDEVISQIPKNFGSIEEYEKVVTMRPNWARDLPIVVGEPWRGKRYRK